jgi:hypothetical protein
LFTAVACADALAADVDGGDDAVEVFEEGDDDCGPDPPDRETPTTTTIMMTARTPPPIRSNLPRPGGCGFRPPGP